MSVRFKGGTQSTTQLTMPHFTQMMSLEESTGIFRRATPSTLTSQEMCLSPRALLPLRRLQEDRKRNSAKGCLFQKGGDCRSTPARHAASPYRKERHPNA